MFWRKWVVSLTYDLCLVELGLRKQSTRAEIFSVGQPLAKQWVYQVWEGGGNLAYFGQLFNYHMQSIILFLL